ncbi:MAG: hypothetical protein IPF98_24505 [Gemmatimonadetes bacterium]|nr:hypothetical protein [Gemmatimonadota bacterium]
MTLAIVTFVLCGAIIVLSSVALTRAAEAFARSTNIGRVWIGTVLLASATSLPELGVDVSAVRQGAADLAAGDIFGSSMANMLILALLGMVPPRDDIFRRTSLDNTIAASLGIIMTAIVGILVYSQATTTVAGVHPASVLLVVLFLIGSRILYRQASDAAPADAAPATAAPVNAEHQGAGQATPATPGDAAATDEDETDRARRRRVSGTRFLASAAVLLLLAPLFADSAQTIAEGTGLGLTFFGTLFVGASTSLPELVSCVAALRMGARDLAVGNLFGSNVFNASIFLAMDLAHPGGSIFAIVGQAHVVSALFAVLLMALGSASIAFRATRRHALIEPGAVLMLLAYVTGVVALYQLRAAP